MPGRKFLWLRPFEGTLIIVTEQFLCAHFQPQTLGGLTGGVRRQCGVQSDNLGKENHKLVLNKWENTIFMKNAYRARVPLNCCGLVGVKTELWYNKEVTEQWGANI